MSYRGLEYGGFDPMDGNDGGFFGGNDDPTGGQKGGDKKSRQSSIRPISIKQFNDVVSDNDTLKLDNSVLSSAIIIGNLDSIDDKSTNVTYYVNDGTGVLECKKWYDVNAPRAALRLNTYVRVIGEIREYEKRRHLLIYDIRPIEDWNEVTHHLLDSIYHHLLLTAGPITPGGVKAEPGQQSYNMGMGNIMKPKSMGMTGNSPTVGMRGLSINNNQGKESLDAIVYNVFRSGSHLDVGYDVSEVLRILNQQGIAITSNQIRSIVEELSGTAILYSTCDENHYKPTDENYTY